MIPASHPGRPVPCRIDVSSAAALDVLADRERGLVIVQLAAEPDAALILGAEQALILGALLSGAARAALPGAG